MNSDTYALGLLGRLSEESPGETPRQRSFSRADTKRGNPEAASGSPILISLHVQRSLRFQTRWPPCAFAGVIVRHSALCLRLRVTKKPLCPRTLHHSWCPGLPRELGVSSEGFPASFTCKAQQSSLLLPTNLQENQTFFFFRWKVGLSLSAQQPGLLSPRWVSARRQRSPSSLGTGLRRGK